MAMSQTTSDDNAVNSMEFDLVPVAEFDALLIDVRRGNECEQIAAGGKEGKKTKYPAKLHARKVVSQLGIEDGLIYLVGEFPRIYEDSDMSQPFRQRRNFFYLTGVDTPGCMAVYEVKADRLTLFIPFIEARTIMWNGRFPSPQDWLRNSDLDDVRYTSQLKSFLKSACSRTTIYVLHRDPNHMPPVSSLPLSTLTESAPTLLPHAVVVDTTSLAPAMERARMIKTAYEVAQIRRANAISSAAHRAVASRFLAMTNEREVEAVFTAACVARGAHSQAYNIIAGAGLNASTLHYDQNEGPLKKGQGQLLVLDAGCSWRCYASDITRTLPVGGKFTAESRAVYDLVDKMQVETLAMMRPGQVYYKAHVLAARVAMEGLLELGILRGDPEDIWAAGTTVAFFPHGLGHHVGLETHDGTSLLAVQGVRLETGKRQMVTPFELVAMSRRLEDSDEEQEEDEEDEADDKGKVTGGARRGRGRGLGNKSWDSPSYGGRAVLKRGMVITVEPGLYFCREYIEGYYLSDPSHAAFIDRDRLESYYLVGGCRIEDDILITDTGYEKLTTAPKGQELWDLINGRVCL